MSNTIQRVDFVSKLQDSHRELSAYHHKFFGLKPLDKFLLCWLPVIVVAFGFMVLLKSVPGLSSYLDAVPFGFPRLLVAVTGCGAALVSFTAVRRIIVPMWRRRYFNKLNSLMPDHSTSLCWTDDVLSFSSSGWQITIPKNQLFAVTQNRGGVVIGSQVTSIFVPTEAFASTRALEEFLSGLLPKMNAAARERSTVTLPQR